MIVSPCDARGAKHLRDLTAAGGHLLLDLPTPPTAIFAADGTMSEGVVRALSDRDHGLPRDLSRLCRSD